MQYVVENTYQHFHDVCDGWNRRELTVEPSLFIIEFSFDSALYRSCRSLFDNWPHRQSSGTLYPLIPVLYKRNGLSGARTFSSSWNLRDGTKANYALRRVRGLSGSHKGFLPICTVGLPADTVPHPPHNPTGYIVGLLSVLFPAVWRVFKTVGLCASGTVIWPLIKTLYGYIKPVMRLATVYSPLTLLRKMYQRWIIMC